MGKQQAERHKNRWLHNRQFLGSIDDKYYDWMVTVAFYCAVHCVHYLFEFDGTSMNGGHDERNSTLRGLRRYKALWLNYQPLYNASMVSRYSCNHAGWITTEEVKGTLVAHHLHQVEKSVLKLTSDAMAIEPVKWQK
jgi:hypothetical protein